MDKVKLTQGCLLGLNRACCTTKQRENNNPQAENVLSPVGSLVLEAGPLFQGEDAIFPRACHLRARPKPGLDVGMAFFRWRHLPGNLGEVSGWW